MWRHISREHLPVRLFIGNLPYSASEADLRRLFVPFGDLTNGTETYPGGRYLDLDRTATGIYDLDFNRAYHPFCLFNPKYDCPVPPRENRLKLPVRAGERLGKPSAER